MPLACSRDWVGPVVAAPPMGPTVPCGSLIPWMMGPSPSPRADRSATGPDRRPRRVRGDGGAGAARHRADRDRGGGHHRRLAAAQLRHRTQHARGVCRRGPGRLQRVQRGRPRGRRRSPRSPWAGAGYEPRVVDAGPGPDGRRRPGRGRPSRRAVPAIVSSRPSATTSVGPAGCSPSPTVARSRTNLFPAATPFGPPPRTITGRPGPSSKTLSSSGPIGTDSRSRTSPPRLARRPGFQPWNLRVVTDPDDQIVGAAYVVLAGELGYVEKVAVKPCAAGPGPRPGPAGRRLRSVPSPRGHCVDAVDGLTNGRPRPLREGRHGGRRRLAAPFDRALSRGRPALTSARHVPTVNQEEPRRREAHGDGTPGGLVRRSGRFHPLPVLGRRAVDDPRPEPGRGRHRRRRGRHGRRGPAAPRLRQPGRHGPGNDHWPPAAARPHPSRGGRPGRGRRDRGLRRRLRWRRQRSDACR